MSLILLHHTNPMCNITVIVTAQGTLIPLLYCSKAPLLTQVLLYQYDVVCNKKTCLIENGKVKMVVMFCIILCNLLEASKKKDWRQVNELKRGIIL